MNIKQFRDKLLHNWQVKLSCIAIAIIVYFFHQFSGYTKKTLVINLNLEQQGIMTPAEQLHVKNVKVIVRGKNEDIQRISEDNFYAFIDIASASKPGSYKFPVLLIPDSEVIAMDTVEISTKPEYVEFAVDEKYERYVQVQPMVKGVPAQNFDYEIESVNPSSVKLSGPKKLLQNMKSIQTAALDVDRKSGEFEINLPVENKNPLVSFASGQIPYVDVKVRFQENKKTKSFTSLTPEYRSLAENLVVESENSLVDIQIEGPVSKIDMLRTEDINPYLDFAGITEEGNYELPVRCLLPQDVNTVNISPVSYKVTVRVMTEEEMQKKLEEENKEEEKTQELDSNGLPPLPDNFQIPVIPNINGVSKTTSVTDNNSSEEVAD